MKLALVLKMLIIITPAHQAEEVIVIQGTSQW